MLKICCCLCLQSCIFYSCSSTGARMCKHATKHDKGHFFHTIALLMGADKIKKMIPFNGTSAFNKAWEEKSGAFLVIRKLFFKKKPQKWPFQRPCQCSFLVLTLLLHRRRNLSWQELRLPTLMQEELDFLLPPPPWLSIWGVLQLFAVYQPQFPSMQEKGITCILICSRGGDECETLCVHTVTIPAVNAGCGVRLYTSTYFKTSRKNCHFGSK